jgi:hypothetical protein
MALTYLIFRICVGTTPSFLTGFNHHQQRLNHQLKSIHSDVLHWGQKLTHLQDFEVTVRRTTVSVTAATTTDHINF